MLHADKESLKLSIYLKSNLYGDFPISISSCTSNSNINHTTTMQYTLILPSADEKLSSIDSNSKIGISNNHLIVGEEAIGEETGAAAVRVAVLVIVKPPHKRDSEAAILNKENP